MSLRRFVAGPVSFGLNVGLAFYAGEMLGWDPSSLPWLALIAWGVGLALATASLKVGWPIIHTGTSGALLLAALFATGTAVWALPLAGAVAAIALARFASVGLASRWLSYALGIVAVGLLGLASYRQATGSLALGGDGTSMLEFLGTAAALLVVAVLGLWHSGGDEGEE